ncbi:MAG: hypothetical protein QF718_04930 [Phycisphaerales bacterium]|jgi:hypothetical protein|nr:hypothetical protein [Phycisphaerales bacterium]
MFLPVILMHRYGWLGFWIFSIPNVIGCTAFGYVLRTPERSKELVEKYKTAISLFAIVTVAFHIFFIAMIGLVYFNNFSLGVMSLWVPFCILLAGAFLAFLPTKVWPIIAAILWVFSVIAGLTFLPFKEVPQGEMPWQDAIWLLPITTFGFFLSPYLDPTFHRALQCSPSKHSFGIFGLTFIVMIGITTAYLGIASPNLDSTIFNFSILLGLHFALQSIFTIGAHIKEGLRIELDKRKPLFIVILAFACLIAVGIAHRAGGVSPSGNWLPQWQDDYLRFFVFYGLIFPGLVATFMLTRRTFTPIRVALFALIALLSLPLLEIGYLGNQAWLSVLPVVVLLTWAFADRTKSVS